MADRNSTVDRSAGDGPALPDFNSRPVQTPTAIGDFSQPPGPSIYPRRVRAARSRKYNLRSLDQTTGRSRHPSVVRTLTYESSPEHPSCSRPASNMAGNRVYMIDYQRPRPVPEKRRRRDSSDSDGEPDRTPREKTARRTLTRLLNHARVHLTLDERALRCLSCGLLPSLPVTGICGHTRCTGCIRRHPKCPCGAVHTPWLMNVNVVVQEVIQKLVSTEQEVRQWLWETRDVNQLPHQQHHFMSGAPPPQFAAGLYVGLPPEAPDTNRNEGQKENGEKASNNQQDVASVGTPTSDQEEKEKGNDDMEEDGAWALPEAERQRRKMEERMAKNRIPITPQARLQYGTYLMDEYRYKDAIPHLARAAIDSQIARPARRMLSQALLQLSRLYVLGEIEGELRQAISSQAASNWLRGRDFECIYCFDSFCRPITTPCGHTFCRPCLEKSLDYRGTCALCMQSLDLIQFSRVGVNQFLTSTLQSIGIERIPLPLDPHVIPILACTVTFPGMPCPLFLFDPRYWYMIRRILESNSRKFGMVASEREGTHSQYGTILEIRDCVHLQDGCTIVSTVGVSRFRVIERSVWDGWCDVARVVTITDIPVESEETVAQMRQLVRNIAYKAAVWFGGMGPELRANIETAFGSIPCLDTRGRWWTQPDGPAWLWWLISILPLNLEIKILMLATDSLLKRMRAVLRTLDTALAQPPHSVREYESALADWWMQRHL